MPLPPLTAAECKRRGPPVFRTPRDDNQTTTELTNLSGVDIAIDLDPRQQENLSTSGPDVGGVAEIRAAT